MSKIYETKFDDEIKQFQSCFNQSILLKELEHTKDYSEEEQLKYFWKDILKKRYGTIKNIINNEKKS